jgi:hypothetical protein
VTNINKVLVDSAAGYLGPKGAPVHLEALGEHMWEAMIRQLLEADPRFVESSGGMFELAANRERRAKALAAG